MVLIAAHFNSGELGIVYPPRPLLPPVGFLSGDASALNKTNDGKNKVGFFGSLFAKQQTNKI